MTSSGLWELGLTPVCSKKFCSRILCPLNPPPPNQQSDGFPQEFVLKGPQTELRTLNQNCEQILLKLRTNRIVNKRVLLSFGNSQTWLFQAWLFAKTSYAFAGFCAKSSFALFCTFVWLFARFCALLRTCVCAFLCSFVAPLNAFTPFCIRPLLEQPPLRAHRLNNVKIALWDCNFQARSNMSSEPPTKALFYLWGNSEGQS